MDDRIRYVYKVFDKLNENKIYIGSSFDVDKRWYQHKKNSNSRKLKADMLEFGTQDFGIEIIFEGTEDEAYEKEIQLIAELKPYYNNDLDRGGKWALSTKGEDNYKHKLTEKDVIDICNRVVIDGEQVCDVGKNYPFIDISILYGIVNGKTWKHVDVPRKKATNNKGENCGTAKLTEIDIINICNRSVINGEQISNIAKDYPFMAAVSLYDIINGKKWKHVDVLRKKITNNKGENNGGVKLSEKDVIDICNRVVIDGEQVCDVGKDYPFVTREQLYGIVNGKTWKHVDVPRKKAKKLFTKDEALDIRALAEEGFSAIDIQNYIYTDKKIRAIKRIINRETFKNI